MKTIELIAVGDIMIGGKLENAIKKGTNPFKKIKKVFTKTSINFGNLECVISKRIDLKTRSNPNNDKCVRLRCDPESTNILNNLNLRIVSIANNHICDFGKVAFEDTLHELNKKKIEYVGAGNSLNDANKPKIISVKNKKIGFLAYSDNHGQSIRKLKKYGTAPNDSKILYEIKKLKNKCDIVVVSAHTGLEFYEIPELNKITKFRKLANAGADVVLGHHPHICQGIERYKNGLIFYSLGNFIFDFIPYFNGKNNTDKGIIVKIKITPNNNITYDTIPYKINRTTYQIEPLDPFEEKKFKNHINEISTDILKKSKLFWKKEFKKIILNLIKEMYYGHSLNPLFEFLKHEENRRILFIK